MQADKNHWASRLALAMCAALAGCAGIGSPPLTPVVTIPRGWNDPAPPQAVAVVSDWWKYFASAELSRLVDLALASAPDLVIAGERVRQAEAQARVAGASLFPGLNLSAGSSRQETRAGAAGGAGRRDSSAATFAASYEIDFWGGNAAAARAAENSLLASRFDRATARLTLLAGVANGYFQLLTVRARMAFARENLAIAERVLAVVDVRYRNGAASALDLSRQRTAVLSQKAALPPLELLAHQTLSALAVLVGAPPQVFDAGAMAVNDIAVPVVTAGLPARVLTRRPDIASAEAQLAAANANLAAARAALLPSIQLTGAAGLSSVELFSLLNAPLRTLSAGLALSQPIFDAGRLRGQVEFAAARERELVEGYRKAILAALSDVEVALSSARRTAEQEQLLDQVRVQAQRALRLAELRYREGADDLLSVLDAQRTLFQAQDQLAQLRLSRLQAAVGLFKALGGGWEPQAEVSSRAGY